METSVIRWMLMAMLCFGGASALPGFAQKTSSSAPPETYQGDNPALAPQLKKAYVESQTYPNIVLATLTKAELQVLLSAQNNQAGQKRKKLAVGIGRIVDEADSEIDLSQLNWSAVAGGRVAQLSVTSPDAAAIRVQVDAKRFPEGAELRFFNPTAPDQVPGPFNQQNMRFLFWSPTMNGPTVVVEIYLPKDANIGDFSLKIPRVSHLL